MDLVIDFDLSQSLLLTDDGTGTISYICKPVLHIVDYFEAATMIGIVADDSFTNFSTDTANITVLANGEIYTEVIVDRNPNPAEFSIFWLVPIARFRSIAKEIPWFAVNAAPISPL